VATLPAVPLTPDSASAAFSIAHEASGTVIDGAAIPLTNPTPDRRADESHYDSPDHYNCAAEPQAARSHDDGHAPQTAINRSPNLYCW
jgi:hypothetical protein